MLFVLDLVLLLGLTLRLSRIITTDYIGEWWLREPAEKWAVRNATLVETRGVDEIYATGWRGKLVTGLECPFCIGFWIGIATLISLFCVGGPGDAAEWWRYAAGVFTLNYVVGHVSGRLDA